MLKEKLGEIEQPVELEMADMIQFNTTDTFS